MIALQEARVILRNKSMTLSGIRVFINGVFATNEDLHELEKRLRAGSIRATAQCHDGIIYYNTIG